MHTSLICRLPDASIWQSNQDPSMYVNRYPRGSLHLFPEILKFIEYAYNTRSLGTISLELLSITNSHNFDMQAIGWLSCKRIPPKLSFFTSMSKANGMFDLRRCKPSCCQTLLRIALTVSVYLAAHTSYVPLCNNADIYTVFFLRYN